MSAPLWDVFISHASEDKEQVARPLAKLLANAGLRVWIDENELRLGDSLRRKIDQGLASSRYGVVVLSRSFFAKEWPQRELDALSALDSGSDKVILPVWHGIDHSTVARCSPTLADKLAVSTDRGLDHVAVSIVSVVSGSPREILRTYDKQSAPPPREFLEPKSLLGQSLNGYELNELIGSGGSGVVFRGIHKPTRRETAVKVFYPVRGVLFSATELLERGYRALSALRHPNIVGVLEFNTASVRGLHVWYLAMEYVSGLPLDEWSRRIENQTDAFDCRLEAAIDLANALLAAHNTTYTDQLGFEAHGVLHGDVKPANVIVANNGKVELLDFLLVDIQRLLDPRVVPPEYLHEGGRKRRLTEAFGTPGYMAPEQENHGLVSTRTDIFGLGMTFAHLFAPTSDNAAAQIFMEDGIPRTLCDLIGQMIANSPTTRPNDMGEVVARLKSIRGGRRGSRSLSSLFERIWHKAR
jgi:serine/threonine protein kinase